MKKLSALFLALVMLALPVLGLAASPAEMLDGAVEAGRPLTTTVSFIPGTLPVDAETAALVNDMLNALALRVSNQEGDAPQTDVALMLSGNDVLTFSTAVKDDVVYVNSSLLGPDTISANAEEGEKLMERIVQMLVDSGAMPQEAVDAFKQQLDAAMNSTVQSTESAEMDTTALMALVEKITASATVEEVTAQPKNCDPATTKLTMTMTGEDMVTSYTVLAEMLKSIPEVMQSLDQVGQVMDGGPMTGAQLLDTMVEMIRQAFEQIEMTADVTLYFDEAGDMVAFQALAPMVNKEEAETLTLEYNYSRLTTSEGVTYTAGAIGQDGENNGVSISFDMLLGESKTVAGISAAEIKAGVTGSPLFFVTYSNDKERTETSAKDAMKIELVVQDEETGEPVQIVVTADIAAEKQNEDVACTTEAKLYLTGIEDHLIGVKVESVTGNAAPSIVAEDTLRPGAMDDAEFNAFLNSIVQNLQMNLMVVLQNLPASVLQMMTAQ